MRRTASLSLATLLLALGSTAMAQEAATTGNGTVTYIPTSVEMVPLPDGTTLQRTHVAGVVIATDPAVPFHLSAQDCVGSTIVSADGQPMAAGGYCDGIDADGDVSWIGWHNGPDGNTWSFIGGTGKYASIEGGGTTTPIYQGADGRSVISWEGTWSMP